MAMDRAVELWDAIVEKAGLDLKLYDRDLLLEVAASLGIHADNFSDDLDRAGVPAQLLLETVLLSIAPYGSMLSEILAFFAAAGARASSGNLSVRFDFGTAGTAFEFDLTQFREWESQLREVLAKVAADEIDEMRAFQIRHAFILQGVTYRIAGSRWIDSPVEDETVAKWLARDPASVGTLPPPPVIIDAELRSLLARVWALLRAANRDPGAVLADADVRVIVRGAYLLRQEEALLLERLRPLYSDVRTSEVETRTLIEELYSVFNLPVWQRRSEFYSIWVGARLMGAFGDAIRVHVVDRTLVFAFGGSHLATIRLANGENLHVWCELRTEATAGVVGKGRKHRIQPDYVILREPTTHPASPALVVECKQYLAQSRSAFANALIDYASNHQVATIVLVNYGPTTGSVMEEVKKKRAEVVPRTHVIGTFRPRSDAALREFEELVGTLLPPPTAPRAIPDPRPGVTVANPPMTAPSSAATTGSGKLRLSWSGNVDLDLHCWMTSADSHREHVHYSHRSASAGTATIVLDQDIRSGGGSETLAWECAEDVALDFAVFVYTPGAGLEPARPQVEVDALAGRWTLQPPVGQDGRWWNLFRIERGGSSIRMWNSVGATAVAESVTT